MARLLSEQSQIPTVLGAKQYGDLSEEDKYEVGLEKYCGER